MNKETSNKFRTFIERDGNLYVAFAGKGSFNFRIKFYYRASCIWHYYAPWRTLWILNLTNILCFNASGRSDIGPKMGCGHPRWSRSQLTLVSAIPKLPAVLYFSSFSLYFSSLYFPYDCLSLPSCIMYFPLFCNPNLVIWCIFLCYLTM